MSSADPLAVLEVNERNELESLLLDFDENWAPGSFEKTAHRVASHPDQRYGQLALAELVKVDLQRSWSAEIGRVLEEYLGQFPSLGTTESVAAALVVAEFEARRNVDADPALASYETRFPKQFPQVQHLVSQLTESSVTESSPKPTEPDLVQASIDTSRIDQLRDTKGGKKRETALELPVEFGRYRILKELGSGAMGKVYLAHDSQLDRQVALKTPSFSGSSDDDMVTRFYREARAAAKIHHRNICPIYDVGEIDGRHFITMAFIKGRCMSEFIKPGKLPPQRTSAILVQRLAVALAEAHKHNVIHRDLKPANIMIDLKKEPVVMDFGLARQMDVESRVTQSGMAVGTPAYMSPEQIRGELDEVGTSADIYALGVILYELLTGQLPFRGPIAKVVYGIVNETPVAPSQIRDDVDPDLESICSKMMAKKREERYLSMEDVAIALKNDLKGKKRTVKPITSERQSSPGTTAESNVEQLTETGALNAFFAAQVSQDPTHTQVEPGISPQLGPVVRQKTKTSSQRGGGRSKLVALGLGGFALLAGVIIYFSDGSKVEIEDGTHAEVQTNSDGTLKSLKTAPRNPPGKGIKVSSQPPSGVPFRNNQNFKSAPSVDGMTTINATGGANSIAVSPNGQYIAGAGEGVPGRITIWDANTAQSVSQFDHPAAGGVSPRHLAFSPDGQSLLFTAGNQFKVIDASDGTQRATMDFPAHPVLVVFPKRTLALALFLESEVHRTKRGSVPQRVRIWNWQTEKILYDENVPYENSTPNSFPAISPDERFLTLARQGAHVRYDLSVVDDQVSIGSRFVMEATGRVRGPLIFSADGKYAATSVKSAPYLAAVLDVESGRIVCKLDPESAESHNKGHSYGCGLAFTRNRRAIALADHTGRAALWDTGTGQLIRELGTFQTTGNHRTPKVAMVANDRVIVAGDYSDPRITIQPLGGGSPPDVSAKPNREIGAFKPILVAKYEHNATENKHCYFAGLSPDGSRVAYRLSTDPMRMIDQRSQKEITLPTNMLDALSLDYNADGSRFATGHESGRVRIWESATLKQIDVYKTESVRGISWLSLSDDASRVVALTNFKDGYKIAAWDTSTHQTIEPFPIDMDNGDAFGDSRSLIFLDYKDSGLKICDVDNRHHTETTIKSTSEQRKWIRQLDLSPSGDRLATTQENRAVVYELASGKELWSHNHGSLAFSVQFSPDGQQLVSCGAPAMEDHMHLWDAISGQELGNWRVPMGEGKLRGETKYGPWVKFLSYSSDGSHLLTAGYNTPVCVWEMKRAAERTPAISQTVSPSIPDGPRAIAQRIVELGGKVRLVDSGNWIQTLPDGDIRIEGVWFFRKQKQLDNGHLTLLARLPELQTVYFSANQMDDEGFASLAEMENVVENVKDLRFLQAEFGPKGLAALATLKRLETLALWHTDLINDDLKLLANLPALKELTLQQYTKKKHGPAFLSDECLHHLTTVNGLQKLTLIGQPFTDEGLVPIAELKIQELWLATSNVTDRAIAKLREKRPRLGVTRFKWFSDSGNIDQNSDDNELNKQAPDKDESQSIGLKTSS